jgi:hypothetical protein
VCGSVGDSRAVIGTIHAPSDLPTPTAILKDEEREPL